MAQEVPPSPPRGGDPIRWAVVGLGHIAQVAVLPAFEHAENAELVALISGDEDKRAALAERHGVQHTGSYDEYEEVLRRSRADAVYIATPNHLHCEHTVRAAKVGVHVLCEKPMAVTEDECRQMTEACNSAGVQLMVAYRLHFERANLEVVEAIQRGDIGDPRWFNASFSMNVKAGDVRIRPSTGGGTLYDIGIYCINAARYCFRQEPFEVVAFTDRGEDPRFSLVEENASAVLRFPGGRLAAFTVSFGTQGVSSFRVGGTRGSIHMEPAFNYAVGLGYEIRAGERQERCDHEKRDQFAPELVYFGECIRQGRRPEPDAHEGQMDIRIIEALYRSAREGRPIGIVPIEEQTRPGLAQEMERPPVDEPPEPYHTDSPQQ